MFKIGTALFEATEELEREKGISKEVIIDSLKDALVAAYKKHIRAKEAPNVEAILDETTGEIGVFRTKLVVEKVEDDNLEISLEDAKEIDDEVELEDEVKIEVTPENFGRIAAQSAKQVITQRIREAERKLVLDEFMEKKGTLTTGIIQRVENRNVFVNIGKTDAILPFREQIPGEYYKRPVKLERVRNPSMLVAMVDGAGINVTGSSEYMAYTFTGSEGYPSYSELDFRHRDGVNGSFLDGHVSRIQLHHLDGNKAIWSLEPDALRFFFTSSEK